MSNKTFGWKAKIEISGDGASTYYNLGNITSLKLDPQIEKEDVTTFDDNGFLNEDAIQSGLKVSSEGFLDEGDDAQSILQKKMFSKQPVFAKVYTDKYDLSKYYFAKYSIDSFSTEHGTTEKTKFSLELTSKGIVDRKGY